MQRHAELFQSLADPTRLRLLNLLAQRGGICVCELADALQLPQYAVSRHLRVLRQAGLIEDHKRGKWVYYRVTEGLKPYQRTLLRAVAQLADEGEDFVQDQGRAEQRLQLRRNGLCCVGLVPRVAAGAKRLRPRKRSLR